MRKSGLKEGWYCKQERRRLLYSQTVRQPIERCYQGIVNVDQPGCWTDAHSVAAPNENDYPNYSQ